MEHIDEEVVTVTWWAVSLVAIAIAALTATATAYVVRRRRTEVTLGEQPSRITITLDIEADDAGDERVQRMVADAALRMFRVMPSLQEIEVRDSRGYVLGHRTRSGRQLPERTMSVNLFEPHTVRRPSSPSRWNDLPAPGVSERPGPMGAMVGRLLHKVPGTEPRALAERFDLSEGIRARITDPDDMADVIGAILEEGRHEVRRDQGMLRVADAIVYLIRTPPGATVTAGALTRAYTAFRASGAPHGYAVALGHVDPVDIRRRELLAPEFVHLGADAVQRMADAAALGADPLRWARAPAIGSQAAKEPHNL